MQRTETDISTGVETVIQTVAWADANGNTQILDAGVIGPAGYSQITDDQYVALLTKPKVPQSVSRFQARAALYQTTTPDGSNLLAKVDALMADPNTTALSKLAWQDAQVFERSSPTVAGMAQVLGLSSTDLDNLFIAAAKIKA